MTFQMIYAKMKSLARDEEESLKVSETYKTLEADMESVVDYVSSLDEEVVELIGGVIIDLYIIVYTVSIYER